MQDTTQNMIINSEYFSLLHLMIYFFALYEKRMTYELFLCCDYFKHTLHLHGFELFMSLEDTAHKAVKIIYKCL